MATTVMLGTVAYPMLAKAGYGKDAASGLLAAGGLGAIISPPVLGAAAFLIAEFLKISYLDVILMATIPTLLYYFALLLMVELDARKFGMKQVVLDKTETLWNLTKKFGFHFLSLVAIIVFMLLGFSPAACRAGCSSRPRRSSAGCRSSPGSRWCILKRSSTTSASR